MASALFALLDDITTLLDDVASAAKVAGEKTAAILGDDLAVNAEKATGFVADRELPILWKITKGSFVNKLIIIPIIFLLDIFLPDAIAVILMLGGFYLAYEGVEKIIEFLFFRKKKENNTENSSIKPIAHKEVHTSENEAQKVKAAIYTDFVLSLEIVIIALATVLDASLQLKIITVSIVAFFATVGVYGFVALIVRMDDMGFKLIKKSKGKGFFTALGKFLVRALPIVIKVLAVLGTLALLSVAGGIFHHHIDYLQHYLTEIPDVLAHFILGIAGGLLAIPFFFILGKLLSLFRKKKTARN